MKSLSRLLSQQHSQPAGLQVAGYVRRSSEMQRDNFSLAAQKRAIREAAQLRGLPEPVFYEDDERLLRRCCTGAFLINSKWRAVKRNAWPCF